MNNNTQTKTAKTIKSNIKYFLYALLLLMAIAVLVIIQHVLSFHIAKYISKTAPESPISFLDATNLIIQQGEALSAYLNLLIGLPTSIILALLAIGLAFLAYRTSQQTEKREIKIYERETSKYVREQLHNITLQTDNILNKSKDLYDAVSALNRSTKNGRWSKDFPKRPGMETLDHFDYADDHETYLDLVTSKSPGWDRTYEDVWTINLYDVAKHNVKEVERHEISDFLKKQAEPLTPQSERKRPQIGLDTNSEPRFSRKNRSTIAPHDANHH